MRHVTIYDCEFLTAPGAPSRFWCGPHDPDPLCVQIGAVRLSLVPPFAISEPVGWYVEPKDRDGNIAAVDPLLTRLTGIDDAMLAKSGVPLMAALSELDSFSNQGMLLSWGTDDVLTLSTSLFVQGQLCHIPANRFRSAVPLLVAAGEDPDTVVTLRSNTLCGYFGIESGGNGHDARDDAASVALALRYLLSHKRLTIEDFDALSGASRSEP